MQASRELVDCETELAELLNDLSVVQEELLQVLAAKRECMATNDLESMTRLQPREKRLQAQLQECYDRRAKLLQSASRPGRKMENLERLALLLDKGGGGDLERQVKDASARMRLLRHQSLTNWVLAQRALLHLSQILEIIATGGRLQPTYGKGESASARGALVDREA